MSTDLIVVPKESALQVFSTEQGLDPYLAKIRAEIDGFTPDISTKKGRDAVASIAHKVARSKTYLDGVGKDLVAELKEVPKKIDAERKRVRDTLDAWRDEVRLPLTEWEEAEAGRVAGHKEALAWLGATDTEGQSAEQIQALISKIGETEIGEGWQEFEAEAHRTKAASLTVLGMALIKQQGIEAEQAELARLRAEAAAREQREREQQMVREAEERAQREAEAKAQAERDAAARREQELVAAAERRELELKLQAEQAERERQAAQQRAEQAERDAKVKAEAAAQAERQRQADEQAAIEREAKAREADKQHRASVNRAALDAFMAGGLSEDCAKLAVTLIAKRTIPNVQIQY
ncbi:hypothetical protein [uncultured Pseudomonas sp.]|uniref:hypothetical protein n=1 Tax=uncultured Pseudomonas sp. TaxID=114707 RepID=UPI0025E21DE1|nr:hypothetical protein [uncultured Pseudomonas sp.]